MSMLMSHSGSFLSAPARVSEFDGSAAMGRPVSTCLHIIKLELKGDCSVTACYHQTGIWREWSGGCSNASTCGLPGNRVGSFLECIQN
jgi:hypothetical protein